MYYFNIASPDIFNRHTQTKCMMPHIVKLFLSSQLIKPVNPKPSLCHSFNGETRQSFRPDLPDSVRFFCFSFQKNARHDNGLYVQPPVAMQPQEKVSSNEMVIKKESRDNNIASVESPAESVSAPLPPNVTDNLDGKSSNESIPYCVKTKPYYSINAKLNQREKVPVVVPVNALAAANKYIDKAYSESGVDETTAPPPPALVEDQSITPVVEDVKPPPPPPSAVWDANFKFLAASAPSRTATQTYNKSSVTCLICGKQLSNQYNLRVHMETHSNSSYSCAACSHVSRSRDALRKHVSYRHPVTPPQKRTRYSTSKP